MVPLIIILCSVFGLVGLCALGAKLYPIPQSNSEGKQLSSVEGKVNKKIDNSNEEVLFGKAKDLLTFQEARQRLEEEQKYVRMNEEAPIETIMEAYLIDRRSGYVTYIIKTDRNNVGRLCLSTYYKYSGICYPITEVIDVNEALKYFKVKKHYSKDNEEYILVEAEPILEKTKD